MRRYVKTHLPELGYDKFVRGGDALPVFDTEFGRVGILICFDLRHPEAARCLALAGADLIVLPTNWPDGAEMAAEHIALVRAAENKVFLATCDRVGTENGTHFIGLSKIIDPYGRVLASAGDSEAIIEADIDLSRARDKRNVIIPGKYEITIEESRRPQLYGNLS
jgi:predicted amidohydrolase